MKFLLSLMILTTTVVNISACDREKAIQTLDWAKSKVLNIPVSVPGEYSFISFTTLTPVKNVVVEPMRVYSPPPMYSPPRYSPPMMYSTPMRMYSPPRYSPPMRMSRGGGSC